MHTEQEFIDKWKHELAGLMLDAATSGRHGADLAVWCRAVMKTLDARLAQMYRWLIVPEPKPAAPINGTPLAARK